MLSYSWARFAPRTMALLKGVAYVTRARPYLPRARLTTRRHGRGLARPPVLGLVGQLSDIVGRDIAELLLDADSDSLRATRNAQLATYALSLVALDAARRGRSATTEIAAHGPGGSGGRSPPWPGTAWASTRRWWRPERSTPGRAPARAGPRARPCRWRPQANPGTMAAVLGLDLAGVAKACEETAGAWVANDNTPGQVVVAGTVNGVEQAGATALRLGAKRVVPLQVGGAFHTPLMQPAQEPLDAALTGLEFAPSSPAVVTNVDAAAHSDGFPPLLSAQLCSRVRWRESLLAMAGHGRDAVRRARPGYRAVGHGQADRPGSDAGQCRHSGGPGSAGPAADRLMAHGAVFYGGWGRRFWRIGARFSAALVDSRHGFWPKSASSCARDREARRKRTGITGKDAPRRPDGAIRERASGAYRNLTAGTGQLSRRIWLCQPRLPVADARPHLARRQAGWPALAPGRAMARWR